MLRIRRLACGVERKLISTAWTEPDRISFLSLTPRDFTLADIAQPEAITRSQILEYQLLHGYHQSRDVAGAEGRPVRNVPTKVLGGVLPLDDSLSK